MEEEEESAGLEAGLEYTSKKEGGEAWPFFLLLSCAHLPCLFSTATVVPHEPSFRGLGNMHAYLVTLQRERELSGEGREAAKVKLSSPTITHPTFAAGDIPIKRVFTRS